LDVERSSPRREGIALEREVFRRVLGSAFDLEVERPLRLLVRMALERGVRVDGLLLRMALARGVCVERERLRIADLVARERDELGLFHAAGRERELRLERLALLFFEERLFRLEERLLLNDRPRDGFDARKDPRDLPPRERLADGLRRSSVSVSAWAGTVGTSSARAAKRRMNLCRMVHLPSAGTNVPNGGQRISFKKNIFERTKLFQPFFSSLDSRSGLMVASAGRKDPEHEEETCGCLREMRPWGS